jgi:hypothetical protein
MRKRILLLVAALMLTLTMAFGGLTALGAPKECEPGAPGCKTETTTETTKETGGKSGGFQETTTETQRGNVNAPGTEPGDTTTQCVGPSGKPLEPDHPQCQ